MIHKTLTSRYRTDEHKMHLYDSQKERARCGALGGVYNQPQVTGDKEKVTCERCQKVIRDTPRTVSARGWKPNATAF